MDKNNDCLKKAGKPQTYGFKLEGTDIQFCLHRGMEWDKCFLLIKIGQEVKELRLGKYNDQTVTVPKELFCDLFTIAAGSEMKNREVSNDERGKIFLRNVGTQLLSSEIREYLKEMEE